MAAAPAQQHAGIGALATAARCAIPHARTAARRDHSDRVVPQQGAVAAGHERAAAHRRHVLLLHARLVAPLRRPERTRDRAHRARVRRHRREHAAPRVDGAREPAERRGAGRGHRRIHRRCQLQPAAELQDHRRCAAQERPAGGRPARVRRPATLPGFGRAARHRPAGGGAPAPAFHRQCGRPARGRALRAGRRAARRPEPQPALLPPGGRGQCTGDSAGAGAVGAALRARQGHGAARHAAVRQQRAAGVRAIAGAAAALACQRRHLRAHHGQLSRSDRRHQGPGRPGRLGQGRLDAPAGAGAGRLVRPHDRAHRTEPPAGAGAGRCGARPRARCLPEIPRRVQPALRWRAARPRVAGQGRPLRAGAGTHRAARRTHRAAGAALHGRRARPRAAGRGPALDGHMGPHAARPGAGCRRHPQALHDRRHDGLSGHGSPGHRKRAECALRAARGRPGGRGCDRCERWHAPHVEAR